LKALTRRSAMLQHRGFSTTKTNRTISRSRSRLRERPCGARARARLHDLFTSSPRVDPLGASGQRSKCGGWAATQRNPSRLPAGVEGTFILARQEPHRLERKPARNGRSRAKRRAAAASGAGRYIHTLTAGHIAQWEIYIFADSERSYAVVYGAVRRTVTRRTGDRGGWDSQKINDGIKTGQTPTTSSITWPVRLPENPARDWNAVQRIS